MQENFKAKFVRSNIGTLVKVDTGEFDNKIEGPLLLQCCYDVKLLCVIAKNPGFTEVVVNTLSFNKPGVITLDYILNYLAIELVT